MENKFEINAIVELFGHQKMAGVVTEQTIGGASFIRIDVPETEAQPSFSRMMNPSAIYAINPVTEEVMLEMAHRFQKKPIESWDIREMQKKLMLLNSNNENTSDWKPFDDDDDLPI